MKLFGKTVFLKDNIFFLQFVQKKDTKFYVLQEVYFLLCQKRNTEFID